VPKLDLRHMLKSPPPDVRVPVGAQPPVIPLNRRFHVVPRDNGEFACGFCGKVYRNKNYAWMCVAQCSGPILEKLRVGTRVEFSVPVFFCPLCLHEYLNKEDATNCLEKCRDRAMGLLPSEASRLSLLTSFAEETKEKTRVRELVVSSTLRTRERLFSTQGTGFSNTVSDRELLNLIPVLEGKKMVKEVVFVPDEGNAELENLAVSNALDNALPLTNPPKEEVTTPSVTSSVQSEVPALDPPVDSAESGKKEVRIQWKPGLKPFHRLGAQYVCNACKEKYFSKVEVEACYKSHPVDYPEDKEAKA
jgi:hypothetical protein